MKITYLILEFNVKSIKVIITGLHYSRQHYNFDMKFNRKPYTDFLKNSFLKDFSRFANINNLIFKEKF